MRLCWGKASFDVDADAEDAALKKVDDADDDVLFGGDGESVPETRCET